MDHLALLVLDFKGYHLFMTRSYMMIYGLYYTMQTVRELWGDLIVPNFFFFKVQDFSFSHSSESEQ
jgi:hypothetical protein